VDAADFSPRMDQGPDGLSLVPSSLGISNLTEAGQECANS
jgi:hypothetical protein